MALEFVNDAISLSGLTGSRLKCEVIGDYYSLWWNITSGGQAADNGWPTAIVELDAATGEVYIAETRETILGSSGHALHLKCSNPNARNLKVILVERDDDCYEHLKRVVNRRWPGISVGLAEGPMESNPTNIYLLHEDLENALKSIDKIKLGNALFFFDPLRSVEYRAIEAVAKKRITTYYRTGTEFIVFIFTSDWFLGRNNFAGLPTTISEKEWSLSQKQTVSEANALFGNTEWHGQVLNNSPIYEKEERLIELYKAGLHRWFRYVLPMPFNPKGSQIFHLILCSNFETGVRATRNFYCGITGNSSYAPDNGSAFLAFKKRHPEIFVALGRNKRPVEWRILWSIITGHEEGICDSLCKDFESIEKNQTERQKSLEWLESQGYLKHRKVPTTWQISVKQYQLSWPLIKNRLGVDPPLPLKPLSLKPLPLKEISK